MDYLPLPTIVGPQTQPPSDGHALYAPSVQLDTVVIERLRMVDELARALNSLSLAMQSLQTAVGSLENRTQSIECVRLLASELDLGTFAKRLSETHSALVNTLEEGKPG